MLRTVQPALHADQHLPWGSDPLNGFPAPSQGASLEFAYLTPGGLEAWWRLGEDTATFPTVTQSITDWAADSSGHNRHLRAVNSNHAGSAVQLSAGSPNLPSHITDGVYPAGADDGGIQFNYTYNDTLVNGGSVGLDRGMAVYENTDFAGGSMPVGGGWTLSAFVQYTGTLLADVQFLGNAGASGSDWYLSFTSAGALKYNLNSTVGSVSGPYYTTPGALATGDWYHLAVTISRTATTTYQRRILVNLNEVVNVTGTAATIALSNANSGTITMGGYWSSSNKYSAPAGLDEISLWSKALSDTELSNIF